MENITYNTVAKNTRTEKRNILIRMSNEYVDGERKELWVTKAELSKFRNYSIISLTSKRLTRAEGNKEVEDFEMNHHLAQYDNSDMHHCDLDCCKRHKQYWKDKEAKGETFMRKVKNSYGDYHLIKIN